MIMTWNKVNVLLQHQTRFLNQNLEFLAMFSFLGQIIISIDMATCVWDV